MPLPVSRPLRPQANKTRSQGHYKGPESQHIHTIYDIYIPLFHKDHSGVMKLQNINKIK